MPQRDDASDAARGERPPSTTVRSVERCIDIIDLLATARQPMSLSAISRAIGSPKSTTLTIVRTLVQRGLLALEPATRHYHIGLGFARYTSEQPRQVDLVELATPLLQALARETLETSTLAKLEGDKVFNVCRFVPAQPLQLVVPIGIARELHATAGGKVFLAWMTDAQRRAYLASHQLRKFTPRTLTDPAALARRVASCRRNGYAIARGETSAELFGVAAPILDADGTILAAVNLSGPLFRLQPNLERYARAVCATAAAISREVARIGGVIQIPDVARAAPPVPKLVRPGAGSSGARKVSA
jgi:DNA-binding IclR family transcriptional regulator